MHSPSLPGRHVPPVPVMPRFVADCDQQIPVTGSATWLALQAAWAGGAVTTGADSSAAPQIAASARREAVNRTVMWFSGVSVGLAIRRGR